MAYLIHKFPYVKSMGIYNCRSVAGSSTLSQHSCGRAGDPGIPTLAGGAADTSLGHPVVRFLDQYSTEFGIVEQIYDRVIYDAASPRGRHYGGVHPHRDHVHFTQTPGKATSLTAAQIVSIVETGEGDIMFTKGYDEADWKRLWDRGLVVGTSWASFRQYWVVESAARTDAEHLQASGNIVLALADKAGGGSSASGAQVTGTFSGTIN
jgi:hypothetical protein